MGRPVTKELQLIEKPGVPIKIYDTVGFELDKKVQKRTIKEIKKLAKCYPPKVSRIPYLL